MKLPIILSLLVSSCHCTAQISLSYNWIRISDINQVTTKRATIQTAQITETLPVLGIEVRRFGCYLAFVHALKQKKYTYFYANAFGGYGLVVDYSSLNVLSGGYARTFAISRLSTNIEISADIGVAFSKFADESYVIPGKQVASSMIGTYVQTIATDSYNLIHKSATPQAKVGISIWPRNGLALRPITVTLGETNSEQSPI